MAANDGPCTLAIVDCGFAVESGLNSETGDARTRSGLLLSFNSALLSGETELRSRFDDDLLAFALEQFLDRLNRLLEHGEFAAVELGLDLLLDDGDVADRVDQIDHSAEYGGNQEPDGPPEQSQPPVDLLQPFVHVLKAITPLVRWPSICWS